jgi:hypothetical protein
MDQSTNRRIAESRRCSMRCIERLFSVTPGLAESNRHRAQRHHHRDCGGGALSHSARTIDAGGRGRACDHRLARYLARRLVCCVRLFHAHLLRPVRVALHRQARCAYRAAAPAGFTSYSVGHNVGRERLDRRRGPLSHLFGLGAHRRRRREALLHCRADFLARQRHCSRARHLLRPGRGER